MADSLPCYESDFNTINPAQHEFIKVMRRQYFMFSHNKSLSV